MSSIGEVLPGDLRRVHQRRAGDNCGPVLVVVEHGYVHLLAESLLDLEALGRLDVLEVYAAEGRFHRLHRLTERVDLLDIELDVEHVDVGEALEQHTLPLHDGLRRRRADVAETEDGRPVRDDRDEVSLRRTLEHRFWLCGDVATRPGGSRR